VAVWWYRPGLVLSRSWYSDTRKLLAADSITPTATAGIFKVRRRYPGTPKSTEYEIVASKDQLIEGAARFTLEDQAPGGWFVDDVTHVLATVEGSGFRSTRRTDAVQFAVDTLRGIEQGKANEAWERRQAARSARAETMSAIYQGLQAAGQIMEEGRKASEAAFNSAMSEEQSSDSNDLVRQAAAQNQAVESARRNVDGSGSPATATLRSDAAGAGGAGQDCIESRVEAGYTGVPSSDEAQARADVARWVGENCGKNGVICGASSCAGINLEADFRQPKRISYTCGIDATKAYRSCGPSAVTGQ
jgi:hypothetical protein